MLGSPFRLISGKTPSIDRLPKSPAIAPAGFPTSLVTTPSRDMTEMLLAESPSVTGRVKTNTDVPLPSEYVADKPFDKFRIGVPETKTDWAQTTETEIVSPDLYFLSSADIPTKAGESASISTLPRSPLICLTESPDAFLIVPLYSSTEMSFALTSPAWIS